MKSTFCPLSIYRQLFNRIRAIAFFFPSQNWNEKVFPHLVIKRKQNSAKTQLLCYSRPLTMWSATLHSVITNALMLSSHLVPFASPSSQVRLPEVSLCLASRLTFARAKPSAYGALRFLPQSPWHQDPACGHCSYGGFHPDKQNRLIPTLSSYKLCPSRACWDLASCVF